MALALGEWNTERDAQCVDIAPGMSKNTARVTIRTNAVSMTDRDAHSRALAVQAAPDDGLAPLAIIYSQFASYGDTYLTFVVTWR